MAIIGYYLRILGYPELLYENGPEVNLLARVAFPCGGAKPYGNDGRIGSYSFIPNLCSKLPDSLFY